jgi:hypothetical protein
MENAIPAALTATEKFLGHELARQTREEILQLVGEAIAVGSKTVETVNPDHGHRLESLCGAAMSRALATRCRPPTGRAATRHDRGSMLLVDPYEELTPWEAWLGLPGVLQPYVAGLEPLMSRLVTLRYGLEDARPLTVAETAEQTRQTVIQASRLLTAAQSQLRSLRRQDIAASR